MKSIFLFFCFVVLALTSQGQGLPRLDLSENGREIKLQGHEEHFLMRARVDHNFNSQEAIYQLNTLIERQLDVVWLRVLDFRMDPNSTQNGSFYFKVQQNRDSVIRHCFFPSLLTNGQLIVFQHPLGPVFQKYTLRGNNSGYYPGRKIDLTLSGSENGVEYELLRGGTKQYVLPGTGSTLTFPISETGIYTVRAVREHVSQLMDGSVDIEASPIFRGRLSFLKSPSVEISPNGGRVEVPFTFTGVADDIFPVLQDAVVSCFRGGSSLWDPSFLFVCAQTGPQSGSFTIVRGPNLRDTDQESRFVLNTQSADGEMKVSQRKGGKLLVADVIGGGEIYPGSAGTIRLSATQPLVTYNLYCKDSLVASQTGGTFTGLTTYGRYRVRAAYDGHEIWMNGVAVLIPALRRYTIGGGGRQANNRDVEITLSGSEKGVMYRLLHNGKVVDNLPGTGSALCFKVSLPGTYQVEGGVHDFYVAMNGSAEVYRNSSVGYSPEHSYTAVRPYLTASGDFILC